MLIVTGIIEVPAEAFEAARPALRKMVAATLEEPGCITYAFWQDPDNPGRLRVYEEWEGRAALEAHFATEHMAEFRAALAELGPVSRDIVAIEAGAVERL
jgi:quinol monooxygenase YgiN